MSEPYTAAPRRHIIRTTKRWLVLALLALVAALPLVPTHANASTAASGERSGAAQAGTTTFRGSAGMQSFRTTYIDSHTTDIQRKSHTATTLKDGNILIVGGEGSLDAPGSAEVFEPRSGIIKRTDDLVEPRTHHTATLLSNGNVLVVGGVDSYAQTYRGAELYRADTDTFVAVQSMRLLRSEHTATLLPSGKVLVTGGYGPDESTARTAEAYDPTTNTWSRAADMHDGRAEHTATLLKDGTALIVGGNYDRIGAVDAEIYDPATNTWAATQPMHDERSLHTATLLRDGKVLVTGGIGSRSHIEYSAELFNPEQGTWTEAAQMGSDRIWHTATLLPDNTVLLIGGSINASSQSIERYDPTTNTWTGVNMYEAARQWHTASLLPDGNVLVHGGEGSDSPYPMIYDPVAEAWNVHWQPQQSRFTPGATLLHNGKLFIAGGYGYSDAGNEPTSTPLYDPRIQSFVPSTSLQAPHVYATATTLRNGNVLIVGGDTTSADIYNPTNGTTALTGAMHHKRSFHTATLLDNGKVLVTGGFEEGLSLATSTAELYDPSTGTWTLAGNMHELRANHTATLLNDGMVLVVGALSDYGSGNVTNAELYDPAANTFIDLGNMIVPRALHTATLLHDGTVLIAGGRDETHSSIGMMERYLPTTRTFIPIDTYVMSRALHTATLLRDGTVMFAGGDGNQRMYEFEFYNPITNEVRYDGFFYIPRYFHTTTLLPDNSVLMYGGIEAVSNPYPRPSDAILTELGTFNTTNTVTGTLTLPSGWITRPMPIIFSGRSATATIDAGIIDDGEWLAAQPGATVTTMYTPTGQGADVPVRLSLRDTTGKTATVVTGTVDVDTVRPTSTMGTLPSVSPRTIALDWSGVDDTSGIAGYDVEVRDGDGAWTQLLTGTTALRTTFTGQHDHTYAFRVRAHDRAGLVEAWPAAYDARTRVEDGTTVPSRNKVFLPSVRR